MKNEFEAKAIKIDKEEIRTQLQEQGAKLVFAERLFTRITFNGPELKAKGAWIRLRDEGDKITLTIKEQTNQTITGMKEISVQVDDLETTRELIKYLGFQEANYQENYREEWQLQDVTFDIDTWPHIDTYLEIEGPDEDSVRAYFDKLNLDYSKAVFGSADIVYKQIYDIEILPIKELRFDKPLN